VCSVSRLAGDGIGGLTGCGGLEGDGSSGLTGGGVS
jgi:hypothetical protein